MAKKNIEIVSTNKETIKFLKAELDNASNLSHDVQDLKLGLANLYDGLSASLLIQLEDNNTNINNTNKITCKDLTIYVVSRKVLRGDKEIFLTPKEFDILYFLASNRGEVFTKEQIYKAVWEDDYLLDDSNIMAFIRKLRKKIEPNPDNPIYIITIWGIGYKFSDDL